MPAYTITAEAPPLAPAADQAVSHYDILKLRWFELAKFAEAMAADPTRISVEPMAGEITAVRTPLERLAHFVDPIIEDYAGYVSAHTGHRIHADYAARQLYRALDGNLLHEIGVAADMVREELSISQEMRR